MAAGDKRQTALEAKKARRKRCVPVFLRPSITHLRRNVIQTRPINARFTTNANLDATPRHRKRLPISDFAFTTADQTGILKNK